MNSAPVTGALDAQTFRNVAKAQQPMVVNIRTESKQKGQDLSDFFGGGGDSRRTISCIDSSAARSRTTRTRRRRAAGRDEEARAKAIRAADPRPGADDGRRRAPDSSSGKDGLILTNNHVIDDATKIEVSLFGEDDDQTYRREADRQGRR